MLGPAGAICGVSPPLATPQSHRRPYWLLVTSPCQDQGVGRGALGGGAGSLAPSCFSDAVGWVLWRGLQRMIPERLEPFANPQGNKAGIISFHELGASVMQLPSSWRGSPLQWLLSHGVAAAKALQLCRGGARGGWGGGARRVNIS